MDVNLPDVAKLIEAIQHFLVQFGTVKGLAVLSYFGFNGWIYLLYNARLRDRQKQIDALSAENREYRERFLRLIDDKMKVGKRRSGPSPALPASPTPSLPEGQEPKEEGD